MLITLLLSLFVYHYTIEELESFIFSYPYDVDSYNYQMVWGLNPGENVSSDLVLGSNFPKNSTS